MPKLTYLRTHPWIKFDLGADRFGSKIWTLLGEAASNAAHIGGIPLAPDAAEKFYQVFMVKGAQATTAIEGNTLSEDQVRQAAEGKLKVSPSQRYLEQEVRNVIDAYGRVVNDLHQHGPRPITTRFLLDLNEDILRDLELDEGISAGQFRHHGVTVGRYRGAPPDECKYLLDEMCDHLEAPIEGVGVEIGAILKALFAHIYIGLIHPFGDGNGRTARMVEFYLLLGAGLPAPTGHLLSNHYNKTRGMYYKELDKISKSGGQCGDFVRYALEGLVDGLREQIDMVKSLQFEVAWENHIHRLFAGQKSVADVRRRELVLHLGKHEEPLRVVDIPDLSPRLAKEYAGKADRTISRDVDALVAMGLVAPLPHRMIEARKDIVRAFLPVRMREGLVGTL